jgi:hypothetical protein
LTSKHQQRLFPVGERVHTRVIAGLAGFLISTTSPDPSGASRRFKTVPSIKKNHGSQRIR